MSKLMFVAAAVAALLSGPALADEVVHSAVVPTGAVDFNNPNQANQVYERIASTARDLCTMNSANPVFARPETECVNRAIAQAVQQANRPLLTAAYQRDAVDAKTSPGRALAGNDQ